MTNMDVAVVILVSIALFNVLDVLILLLLPETKIYLTPYEVLRFKLTHKQVPLLAKAIARIHGRAPVHEAKKDRKGASKGTQKSNELTSNHEACKELRIPAYKAHTYIDEYYMKPQKNLKIPLFLGLDTSTQKPIWVDMEALRHVIVAGQSGMGKSTQLYNIIECIMRSTQAMEVTIIDGKRIGLYPFEFEQRKPLDVLYTNENDAFFNKVQQTAELMDKRAKLFMRHKVTSLKEYNKLAGLETMPYKVIIIDEFDKLYYNKSHKKKNEELNALLNDIVKRGREYGIIAILATQNPSARSVPPDIFAEMGGKICFKLNKKTDSERVLGEPQHRADKIDEIGKFIFKGTKQILFGKAPLTELKDFPFYQRWKTSNQQGGQ